MPADANTVHDLLLHLRDPAYLSAHPFAQALDSAGTRQGEQLRQLLLGLVGDLRPPEGTAPNDPSWRPYLALKLRYVEHHSPLRVQASLSLSERQVRREQSRAIAAIAAMLPAALDAAAAPARFAPPEQQASTALAPAGNATAAPSAGAVEPASDTSPEELTRAAAARASNPTLLSLHDELDGVAAVLAPRLAECRASLNRADRHHAPVFADRVALRQVLIRAIGTLAVAAPGAAIDVVVQAATDATRVCFRVDTTRLGRRVALAGDSLSECDYLAGLSHGRVWHEESEHCTAVCCSFAASRPALLLVIDDEAAAAHLVRRYVEGLGFRVVGLADPKEAYAVATQLGPDAILLDVLMSGRDGWEVLQQLKTLPETSDVPVIVCSVWNEPELAESLGASAFIRKPVTRSLLLETLRRVLPN